MAPPKNTTQEVKIRLKVVIYFTLKSCELVNLIIPRSRITNKEKAKKAKPIKIPLFFSLIIKFVFSPEAQEFILKKILPKINKNNKLCQENP